MNSTTLDRRVAGSRRILKALARVGLVALVVAGLACGGGSEREVANDLVKEALKVHAKGDSAEAAKLYREALVHDATNKFAYYNLGVIDQAAGRSRVAQFQYELALAHDPNFTPALFNLATIVTRSDVDAAIRIYRRIIAIQPRNAGAHLNLGFLLKRRGKTTEGQAEIDRAVALDPSLRSRVSP